MSWHNPFVHLHIILVVSCFVLYAGIDYCNQRLWCNDYDTLAMFTAALSIVLCIVVLLLMKFCSQHVRDLENPQSVRTDAMDATRCTDSRVKSSLSFRPSCGQWCVMPSALPVV